MFRVRPGNRAIFGVDIEAMRFEFIDDLVEVGLGHVHLIEGLDRGETRPAARKGIAGACGTGGFAHARSPAKARACSTSVKQARTALAPLPSRPPRARSNACASVSTVRIALPSGMA